MKVLILQAASGEKISKAITAKEYDTYSNDWTILRKITSEDVSRATEQTSSIVESIREELLLRSKGKSTNDLQSNDIADGTPDDTTSKTIGETLDNVSENANSVFIATLKMLDDSKKINEFDDFPFSDRFNDNAKNFSQSNPLRINELSLDEILPASKNVFAIFPYLLCAFLVNYSNSQLYTNDSKTYDYGNLTFSGQQLVYGPNNANDDAISATDSNQDKNANSMANYFTLQHWVDKKIGKISINNKKIKWSKVQLFIQALVLFANCICSCKDQDEIDIVQSYFLFESHVLAHMYLIIDQGPLKSNCFLRKFLYDLMFAQSRDEIIEVCLQISKFFTPTMLLDVYGTKTKYNKYYKKKDYMSNYIDVENSIPTVLERFPYIENITPLCDIINANGGWDNFSEMELLEITMWLQTTIEASNRANPALCDEEIEELVKMVEGIIERQNIESEE